MLVSSVFSLMYETSTYGLIFLSWQTDKPTFISMKRLLPMLLCMTNWAVYWSSSAMQTNLLLADVTTHI